MLGFYITTGVITFIVFAIMLVRLIWNIRLHNYQKKSGIERSKLNISALRSNVVSLTLLLVVGALTIVGGTSLEKAGNPVSFKIRKTINETTGMTLENANAFSSSKDFEEKLSIISNNNNNQGYRYNTFDNVLPPPSFIGTDGDDVSYSGSGSYVESAAKGGTQSDTYNQVEGVLETDIAKIHSSGKYFFYGPRNSDRIFKVKLDESGNHQGESETVIIDDFTFSDMVLYENMLVVFGYKMYREPYYDTGLYGRYSASQYYYYRSESVYYIIDTETFAPIKSQKVDGYIIDSRLVDNILYVFTNEYISFDEDNKIIPSSMPIDFGRFYYFKGEINSTRISRIHSVDLANPELKVRQIGFVGSNQTVYMGNDLIILVNDKWRGYNDDIGYYNTSSIVAVKYDEKGNLEYVGSQEVEGYVRDQYFLDVHEGMIRVVTTYGKGRTNHLYILKTRAESDNLELLSHLTEGLGKENEDVKSVTFSGNIVKIVTFYQTDPLYTIDLTDPKNPKIISAIEEPGFSNVLFVWDEQNNTIGLGYMVENNRQVGIKISAYRTGDEEPTQTIEFRYEDFGGYIWAEALWNPREHLLMNKKLGMFGFIMNHYQTVQISPDERYTIYDWRGVARMLMFKVDFSLEEPLVLEESLFNEKFVGSEKILLVNEVVHILSPKEDIVWNLVKKELLEPLKFEQDPIDNQ
ncbi:MAG: beta-propeller domain-containing protein [Acholeplasmataceae bacterium]|jgi:uncharacterized secreted protein with C-terminal beta-propeller domain